MTRILLTGFPGFLATGFVPRLLTDRPECSVVCLIEARMRPAAEGRLHALDANSPGLSDRVELVEGDITRAGLGLETSSLADVTEVFHFAAAYDLDLSEDVGERVNVIGTRNVLDWCEGLPNFERLHYVSTCYVSGRYPGTFREGDLDIGRDFNNHYEATKHRAEIEVRARMADGLPVTIYRPAAVVGDSDSGRTEKFDGPYFVIRFLLRQPRLALLPVVGNLRHNRVNVVPRDFIVDAMAVISRRKDSLGRTFQLADPDPPTNDWMLGEMARHTGRRVLRLRLPSGLARQALRTIPWVRRWMGVPPGGIGYFTHPTRYDVSNTTEALSGSGVSCPDMAVYLEKLVDFSKSVPPGADPPGAPPRS